MKKVVLVILLILPWGAGLVYNLITPHYHLRCQSRTSVIYLLKDGTMPYARGTYLMTTALNGRGSGVYSGEIVETAALNGQKTITPVHVFFRYQYKPLGSGLTESHITSLSKEVGNMASATQLSRFLVPVISPGEYHLTRQFVLDGVRQAWGSADYPAGICSW